MAISQKALDELATFMHAGEDFKSQFRGMVYGASGVGKTVLAMQMAQKLVPRGCKILFIDSAQGFATLQINQKWRDLTTNSIRMQYKNLDQLKAVAQALKEKAAPFDNIRVVILDEGSSIAEQDLIAVSKYRTAKDSERDEPNENQWSDRNIMYNRYTDFYYELSAAPVHIITIAHETKDEKGTIKTRPSFGPKLYGKVTEKMHLVGRVVATETNGDYKRTVQVKPTRTIEAKTRIDSLNNLDTEVSFQKILEAIEVFKGGEAELPPVARLQSFGITVE